MCGADVSVAAAFDRATDYDRHAFVQGLVVERLAQRIVDLSGRKPATVLEIGCGTGALGAELIDRLEGAQWRMTDIAPGMIARTAARFAGDPRVSVAIMNGERPCGEELYDLICSSLAVQWFDDLPSAIARLRARLSPGGMLIFTTLAEGSFAEWRAAHAGFSAGTRDYPSPDELEAMGLDVSIEHYPIRHGDARDFLRSLKAIGAGVPRSGHRPLAPTAFRQVMDRFDAGGAIATYVVATCFVRASMEQD